jgi:hypothetical protein
LGIAIGDRTVKPATKLAQSRVPGDLAIQTAKNISPIFADFMTTYYRMRVYRVASHD